MSSPSRQSGRVARLLSIREVAEYCAVSDKTVRRWIDRKQLRAHQLGRQWRIAPDDLETFPPDARQLAAPLCLLMSRNVQAISSFGKTPGQTLAWNSPLRFPEFPPLAPTVQG